MGGDGSKMEEHDEDFAAFLGAEDFHQTREIFKKFINTIGVDPTSNKEIYKRIKQAVKTKKKTPWSYLDKRASQNVYRKGEICKDTKVLVIGCGPCGLRMAIELALLGAKVKVVEARDYFARNNVLHLWPFVIQDLKNLGAKVFHPKFCTGTMDHVCIRRLQLILLKTALILGVEVDAPVTFEGLVEPSGGKGWCAKLSPAQHPWNNYQFDIVIGADGKRNTLKEFKRKPTLKGQQAIAITANFVNHHTREEGALEEIGGIFYVYQKEFFDSLKQKTGIDLENFVYYKDDTHYFVMTAKKKSLLSKGVLKQNMESKKLLVRENINQQKLLDYAKEAATVATKGAIPNMTFAKDHHNNEDAAIFDFSTMYMAENSCLATERQGHRLLQIIVGDTLIEPFWPTGAGCARGFLSVFDAAWMIRHWVEGDRSPVEVIAERESIYKLLAQATPDNLKKTVNQYTIDPVTRYGARVKTITVQPFQVKQLYDTDRPGALEDMLKSVRQPLQKQRPKSILRRGPSSEAKELLVWYRNHLKPYKDKVKISNLTSSWTNGVAFCAILHRFNPDFIPFEEINPSNSEDNVERAFKIIEEEFDITCLMSTEELASGKNIDKVEMFAFLGRLRQALVNYGYGLGHDQPDHDQVEDEVENIYESLVNRLTSIGFTPAPLPGATPPGSQYSSMQGACGGGDAHMPSGGLNENVSRPSLAFCIRTPMVDRIQAIKDEEQKHSFPKKSSPSGPKMTIYERDKSPLLEQPPPKPPRMAAETPPLEQSPPKPPRRPLEPTNDEEDTYVPDREPHAAVAHPSLAILRGSGAVKNRLKAFRFAEEPATVIPEAPSGENEDDNSEAAWGIPAARQERKPETVEPSTGSSEGSYLESRLDLIAREDRDTVKMGYAKELCCLCFEKMLLRERRRYLEDPTTGSGYYFHKKCFRCKTCRCILRYGNVLPHKKPSGTKSEELAEQQEPNKYVSSASLREIQLDSRKQPYFEVSFYCFRHAPQKNELRRYKSNKEVISRNEEDWPDYAASTEMGFGPTSLALYLRENLEIVDEIAKEADEDLKEEEEEEAPLPRRDSSLGTEEDEDDLDDLVLQNQTYASLRSIQLLVAHELQLEVNEMEEMEEEDTTEIEPSAGAGAGGDNTCSPAEGQAPLDESMNRMKIKEDEEDKILKEKLSQRLSDLEVRHRRLREAVQTTQSAQELHRMVDKLEADTERLETAIGVNSANDIWQSSNQH